MLRWSYAMFTGMFGVVLPAGFVFAFLNLFVNTAITIAFGGRGLKIGGWSSGAQVYRP